MEEKQIKRVAIYTRKSTEEGLDMAFNSLDAQREAGEAYVASQKSKGWVCLSERYDDGGYSGGTTERPALKRLLEDAKQGKIDVICVYKIDRLSRSLHDFADMLDFFDKKGIDFVSVTQDINTATSAGRMMLNILITFAQYEREIIAERIRDKIASAKKKGMNTGGIPPVGYDSDPVTKKYFIVPDEATLVRRAFETYLKLGSARDTARELNRFGYRRRTRISKRNGNKSGGGELTGPYIYGILKNPVYAGYVKHYDKLYPGEHEAIISKDVWEKTQNLLQVNCPHEGKRTLGSDRPSMKQIDPFTGIVRCGYCNCAMKPSFTKKGKTDKYRYLICDADSKRVKHTCPLRSIPLNELERIVLDDIKVMLSKPEVFFGVLPEAKGVDKNGCNLTAEQVSKSFADLNAIWDLMYPVEKYKFIQTVIKNITVFRDKIKIEYNQKALCGLTKE